MLTGKLASPLTVGAAGLSAGMTGTPGGDCRCGALMAAAAGRGGVMGTGSAGELMLVRVVGGGLILGITA